MLKTKLAVLEEEKPLKVPFISLEYNVLKIASKDTWTFLYVAVTLTVGVIFFVQALKLIQIKCLSNVILIVFGGIAPSIFAMRVKYWMIYTCKMEQFL